jgi:hypothetical protein
MLLWRITFSVYTWACVGAYERTTVGLAYQL